MASFLLSSRAVTRAIRAPPSVLLELPKLSSFSTRVTSASEAASQLLETFTGTTISRRQLIDGNQLQKLSLALGNPTLPVSGFDVNESAPPVGTPVPPGYHLVYFTPGAVESSLQDDGTDRTFNAPYPFTRRMWAGGKISWPAAGANQQDSVLRVGDEIEERTRLVGATAKKSRSGAEMVVVDLEKKFWGPRGLALIDQRSWIFRPEISQDTSAREPRPTKIQGLVRGPSKKEDVFNAESGGKPVRHLHWSPVGLFRFSSLTFNAHMIHYNQDWASGVESYPGLVVHGPLNLINMLDYWMKAHGQDKTPKEITYRALAPIYAGEKYTIRVAEVVESGSDTRFEVLVEKPGVICMKGHIVI